MKRNPTFIVLALGAVVLLSGCSANSPTAPPQPTPTAYGISLTASPSVAGINESILLVAQLTGTVPDGTPVTFTTTIGVFENGKNEETRTTTGGRATATLVTTVVGDGTVTARVPNKSDSTAVHFRGTGVGQLAVTSVLPNRGKPQGGDQVVIHGQGFVAPVGVNFIVGGVAYPATIVSVAADGSSITVLTPQISAQVTLPALADVKVTVTDAKGVPTSATLAGGFTFAVDTGAPLLYSVAPAVGSPAGGEVIVLTGKHFTEVLQVDFVFPAPNSATLPGRVVSVQHGIDGTDTASVITPPVPISVISLPVSVALTITNGVGTGSSKSATFPGAFTYQGAAILAPVIFYISPTYGSVGGHETVVIYGQHFLLGATVKIGSTPETVVAISDDGTSITITTTPVGGTPPTGAQDVTVVTSGGTATLPAAFTYLEGQTPTIYSLTPNQGPLEGGTRVTINGIGFQYPVQVLFGDRQAQVVSSNYSQVVCISPSVTPSQPNTPTIVSVTVKNLTTGKVSTGADFRYGEAMYISSFVPSQGPDLGGDTVTIFGQGFVAPVSVSFAGYPAAQILTVSGTEVVAVTAGVAAASRKCDNSNTGPVKVTNVDSGVTATSTANWIYLGVQPLITGVRATGTGASGNTSPQTGTACAVDNSVTVYVDGFNFEQYMQVTLTGGGYTFTIPATFDNAGEVHFTLPDLAGFSFNKIGVATTTCASGSQNVPTGMNVTITNIVSKCTNTLTGGLIINPCTSCVPVPPVAPVLTISPTAITVSASGTLPRTLSFTVTITPAQVATLTLAYSGDFAFTAPPASVNTLASGIGSFSVTVPTGVTNLQTAAITVGFAGATPVTANVTIGP